MATNPSGSDIQLQINTTYNSANILTVDGAYRVPTAAPNEIVISGCRTTTLDGGPVIYWLTTINYGTSTTTNIFNAGTYHSRTFVGGGARPLYGGNLSGDPSIVKSATNLGQALNGGGSDIYYVYAANLDSNGVWSNFVRCTFSGSVSGVSTNYFTVTWTNALRSVSISAGSSNTATIPANSSTNWRSSYDAIVLDSGDLGYALDLTLSGSGTHNNIWYATPYTNNVTSTTSPFQSGSSVGRTYGLSASTMRLENSSNNAADEVESIPSEGYAESYRLWGRMWPGSTSTYSGTNYDGTFNVTDGREFDGYYYNGGLFTACRPDTNVTVNGSSSTTTVNITSSATQADVTVAGISSSDQNGFQWRYNGTASGTYGAGSVTPTSTNLPIIANLPAAGTSRGYNLYVKNFSTNSNTVPLHDNWIDTGKVVIVARASSTNTPDAFDLGGPATVNTGVAANSNTITISGLSAQANYSFTNNTYTKVSKNGGTFSTSGGTVVNTDTLQVQITASSTSGVTRSTTLSVGSPARTDTYSVTSSSGSGGPTGSGSSGGTGSYGLEVFDDDGTSLVLGNSYRYPTVLALQGISLSTSGTTSTTISINMSGVTTSNTTVNFLGTAPVSADALASIVTFGSSGITINIANSGISVLNATVMVTRW